MEEEIGISHQALRRSVDPEEIIRVMYSNLILIFFLKNMIINIK